MLFFFCSLVQISDVLFLVLLNLLGLGGERVGEASASQASGKTI